MKTSRLTGLLAAIIISFFLFGNHFAYAAVETGPFCDNSGNGASSSHPQVNTALGCIPVEMDKFVIWLLPYVFGIAGGIAFLIMVFGFIQMMTSGGDPKQVQAAQETITSAITGLLVSIFALFILRLIMVNILKIPGIN